MSDIKNKLCLNDNDISKIERQMGKPGFASTWAYSVISDLLKDRSSLITTIESQKEEIEELKEFQSEVADEYSWMNRLLNSYLKSENKLISEIESLKAITEQQKEEIEKAIAEAKYQVELTLGFNQMYTDISLKLTDKNAEVESLKAITELAVKGLKDQLQIANITGTVTNAINLESILSEIERLSHE